MPTTYTDQFFTMDPASPPAYGTYLSFSRFDLVDNNDDDDIDRFDDDSVDGQDVTRSWPGDTVRMWIPGEGYVTYTGTTFYLADGREVFTPTDGQVLQDGYFISATFVTTQGPLDVGDLGPVCFTPGMQIDTHEGPRAIETLGPGDLVGTLDRGFQPVRWVGRLEACGLGPHAPIRFDTGAIGNDAPLLLSPMHRVLVTGWQSELYFGEPETLAAAHHMVNHATIRPEPCETVTYMHLLLDRHELLLSHGVWSESYFPGHACDVLDARLRDQLARKHPELAAQWNIAATPARRVCKRHEVRLIAA